ncbi:MAG: hypothetical protein LRY69_01825 [Gammaproteobacteria bacterium]|nr:hypothetical protein [Gammaproteobacteria bacterium]
MLEKEQYAPDLKSSYQDEQREAHGDHSAIQEGLPSETQRLRLDIGLLSTQPHL